MPRFSGDTGSESEVLVGRYLLRRPLGAGGMGVVYEAYDPELDRPVAIKLLRDGVGGAATGDASSPSLQARLKREARVMARLAHPNVVAVYDAGVFGDRTFVAMELVAGQTLTAWLAGNRRSVTEVVAVFAAAGRGLAAAHSAGIVHRDFKPENVLIGDDGRVRVTDFGLASAVLARAEPARAAPADETKPLSRGGLTVVGTPYYMAPEQLAGDVADERADQFSFCVALFAALTDDHPLGPACGRAAAASAASSWRLSRHARIPPWLWPVIRAGLARAPDERHPSMEHLLRALSSARRQYRLHCARWCGVSVPLLLGVAALVHPRPTIGAECRTADHEIGRAWNPARAAAVERSLVKGGGPSKTAIVNHVVRSLDGYAQSWISMRREACEATRIRREQPWSVLIARNACLDARASELGHLVERLAAGDAAVLKGAPAAVQSLGPLGPCADSDGLARETRAEVSPTDMAITTDATGAPAIFLRRADGALWHLSSASDSWRSTRLASAAVGRPAAFLDGDALTYVVRRSDGSLWRARKAAGSGTWAGATIAGELADDPTVASVDGRPMYLVRRQDGWLWRGTDGVPGRFRWKERVAALVSGSAAALVDIDNQMSFVARKTDGSLWVGWQSSSNRGEWQSTKLAEQIAGDPQVVVDAIGQITWFARRSDGVLIHGYQAGAGSNVWYKVSLVDGIAGDPALVLDAERKIVCFARRSDGSLWQGWQDAPARGPWHEATIATGVVGDPAVIATPEGQLIYFVTRADGSVWQGLEEAPGAWKESKILEGKEARL